MKCIQAVMTVPMSTQSQIKELVGYCIPCDNLDQNVRPSYQRQDRTTNSLHYFHSYAVKNRIDISNYSDDHPKSLDISPDKILPTQADLKDLLGDFEILIERYNHVYWTCMLIRIISKVYCYM